MKKISIVLSVLVAFAASADEPENERKADSGVLGTTIAAGCPADDLTKEKLEARQRIDADNLEEWKAQRAVDERMKQEAGMKTAAARQEVKAADSRLERSQAALERSQKDMSSAYDRLDAADAQRVQAKQDYDAMQRRADAAVKGNDSNAASLQKEADRLKGIADNKAKAAANAEAEFKRTVETRNAAQNDVTSAKTKVNEAKGNLQKAEQHQKIVEKVAKTPKTPPKKLTPTKTQEALRVANEALTGAQLGSSVYDMKEAAERGDQEAKLKAATGFAETTLGAMATTPGGTAVAAAYGTAKTVVAATAEAGDATRAGKESADAAREAQAAAIARDLFEASRQDGPNGEKASPLSPGEARHLAEGYVYGLGDAASRQKVEDVYASGVLKDAKGNAKSVPKAESAGGISELTAGDIASGAWQGVKDVAGSVGEGAAKTVVGVSEVIGEYADGITDKEVLKEFAKQTVDDVGDSANAVGTVLVNKNAWDSFKTDRVEAIETAVQDVKDAVSSTYGKLTGKETVEDVQKSEERELAYKLQEKFGISATKAEQLAHDLTRGDDSDGAMGAAVKEIHELQKQKAAEEAESLRTAEAPNADTTGGEGKSVAESPATGNFFTDWQGEHQEDLAAFTGLSPILMGEAAQEAQNVLTKTVAQSTLNEGGAAARATLDVSAAETAAAQDATSWGSALANGLQQGVETGAASFGESFGGTLGDRAANSVFGDPNHKNHFDDDWQPSGGGGESAAGGGAPVASGGDSGHTFTITQVADGNGNPVGDDSSASGGEASTSSGKKTASSGKASGDGGGSGHTFTITQVADGNGNPVGKDSTPSGKDSGSKGKCVVCGAKDAISSDGRCLDCMVKPAIQKAAENVSEYLDKAAKNVHETLKLGASGTGKSQQSDKTETKSQSTPKAEPVKQPSKKSSGGGRNPTIVTGSV